MEDGRNVIQRMGLILSVKPRRSLICNSYCRRGWLQKQKNKEFVFQRILRLSGCDTEVGRIYWVYDDFRIYVVKTLE